MAEPALDLFSAIAPAPALPEHIAEGLHRLERAAPLWPVADWVGVVAKVTAFAFRWHAEAEACGWNDMQLYGLHPRAPYTNLAAMGAAWLIAKTGHLAVAVDRDGFTLVTKSSSRLRVYRREVEPDAGVAWELAGPR